ncbi:ribose-5-phosphate isomerase RpiA [Candidatus Dojkabacteria bacterium]|nr:ribose-5-phosphate isomerase RpiA [Candidatus Dojkabacteria bacterium]
MDSIKEAEKKLAGRKAPEFLKNGMVVGLGSGSTVPYAIERIAELVSQGLQITMVSTSNKTSALAKKCKLEISGIDSIDRIDVTIDGADEVDPNMRGIKGGKGALLFEKIVASISDKNIWIVDSSKLVEKLGKFPLSVEVVPFGLKTVLAEFQRRGFKSEIRVREGEKYLTDSGNYIVDLHLGSIENPEELDVELNMIPGVVENGLFVGYADMVIVGRGKETEITSR